MSQKTGEPSSYLPSKSVEHSAKLPEAAQRILGLFRACGGQHADEDWFIERRDRLMQVNSQFRRWWGRHDVGEEHLKRKELFHPGVGLLVVQPIALLVANDPNLTINLYTPLPEAETARKLAQLAQEPERAQRSDRERASGPP